MLSQKQLQTDHQAENNKRAQPVVSLGIVTVIRRRTHFRVVSLWTDVSGFQIRQSITSLEHIHRVNKSISFLQASFLGLCALRMARRRIGRSADGGRETEQSKMKKRSSFRYLERVLLSRLSLLNRVWTRRTTATSDGSNNIIQLDQSSRLREKCTTQTTMI